jgi:hypothetical protein
MIVKESANLAPTSVASGDLAAIALRNGYARKIELMSFGQYVEIDGYMDYGMRLYIKGFWSMRTRRFRIELPLVRKGLWRLGDTYVSVGKTIEVVVNGKQLVSRPNICADDSEFSEHEDKRVYVHVIGSVAWPIDSGVMFTAFRCSDWRNFISNDFYASRFAFDKTNRRTYADSLPIETHDIFVKRGRVVKILVNATCEEYVRTVQRLFGVRPLCIDRWP